jgi:hypothetical protein
MTGGDKRGDLLFTICYLLFVNENEILHCVQNDKGRVTIAIDYGLLMIDYFGCSMLEVGIAKLRLRLPPGWSGQTGRKAHARLWAALRWQ